MKFVSTIFVLAMSTAVVAATEDLNALRGLKKAGKSCQAIEDEHECNYPPEGLECCWKEFKKEMPETSNRRQCAKLGHKDCPTDRRLEKKAGKSCQAIEDEHECNNPPEGLECCWKEFKNEMPETSNRKQCAKLGHKDCPTDRRELN